MLCLLYMPSPSGWRGAGGIARATNEMKLLLVFIYNVSSTNEIAID